MRAAALSRSLFTSLVLLLASAASAASMGAAAQDPFSREAIEQKLEAVQDDESESAQLEAQQYKDALASLAQAAEAKKRRSQYEAETSEAPAFLATLRDELAVPLPEPRFPDPDSFTLSELESRLSQTMAEQASAEALVQELDALAAYRVTRVGEIPKELAAAQQALGVATDNLEATANTPELDARRTELLAEVEEQRARVAALEAERVNLEARREVLPLRRDRAARRLEQAQQRVAFWKQAADVKRAAEGDAAAEQASLRLAEISAQFPELAEVAERNAELAALRSGPDGLPKRIARAQDEVAETRELLSLVDRRFKAARRRIAAGGLTEGMGLILRRDYEWLQQAVESRALLLEREERLSEAQLEQITLEERRFGGGSLGEAVDELVLELGLEDPSSELLTTARALIAEQREAQNAVLDDLMTLTTAYVEQRELAEQVEQAAQSYSDFIEKRILWVRSAPLNPWGSIQAFPGHVRELVMEVPYLRILTALQTSISQHFLRVVGLALVLVVLLASRKRLETQRTTWGNRVRSYRTDKYAYTLAAIAVTVLLALPLPLLMWSLGWLLVESPVLFGRALSEGLMSAAWIWMVLRFLRGLFVERGLGSAHFRWPQPTIQVIRRELLWLEPVGIVFGVIALTMQAEGMGAWNDSIGRLAFVCAMVALALATRQVLKVGRGRQVAGDPSLMARARQAYAFIATVLPLSLALMAVAGYYYTAQQFELRLRYTFGFAILLTLVNAMLLRWLFMARRTLAVNQALEERRRREEEEEDGEDGMQSAVDIEKVDIPAVDAQTRQLFKSSLTLAAVFGFYFIWASVLPALKGLDRVQIFPEVQVVAEAEDFREPALTAPPSGAGSEAATADDGAGSTAPASPAMMLTSAGSASAEGGGDANAPPDEGVWKLTLADILLAIVFGLIVLVAARNLPALLELALLQRLPLDSGSRYAISTIVRYLILIVGVSVVSGALGLSWQKVQWLAAALTFGLAFGLQEIFANFVSGIIILLERPIRVGDTVTVNGIEGRVSQLRMRATTIVDYSLRELLIPNKEFITTSVINWTLSDPVTRLVVKVGVAYGSDTDLTREKLLEVADMCPDVLDEPEPQVIFMQFGDSSLNFELRVFTTNRQAWAPLTDKLHMEIDKAFRRAGIEISFPQRDLHIRSVDQSFHGPPAAPEPGRETRPEENV